MATGGEIVDDERRLVEQLEKCSIGEEEGCTPHCWTDSQIEVVQKEKKSKLITLDNVFPPLLQFLVQNQKTVLQKLANSKGLSIHLDSSKNYPTVKSKYGTRTEEELDGMIQQFVQSIESVCSMYNMKDFSIEDKAWPYLEKEFNEKAKSSFEESILQVYKKSEGTYSLIGLAENFGKYESLLSSLSRQYKAIKIENKELFDFLEMAKILDSRFKKVKVEVHDNQLLLHGEEEVVKECDKYYEELSKTENMHSAIRVISENVFRFLKRGKRRQEIYTCLLEKGFHIYWSVEKQNETCYLVCKCISEIPERGADFITNCLAKEIEFEESYLQVEQVDQQIKGMENAKLFSPESGLKIIVFFGNWNLLKKAETEGAKQKFWFYQTVASSDLLTFLARLEVQKFINSRLEYPVDVWSVIQEKRKIKVYCQYLAEADHLVSSILNQVWHVSRPAEICHNDLVAKFCKDHSNFVKMKQHKKYFTIFVTVDLKDELEKLFDEQSERKPDEGAKDFGRCFENRTERLTLFLETDLREYLTERCVADMTKIQEKFKVCMSFKEANLEFRAISKDNVLCAKQAVLHLLEGISSQTAVVRIKRECTYEMVKEGMDKLARKNSCIVIPEIKKDDEPNYLDCWVAKNIRIVTAEGSLESTMCDVLLCFLDENFQPVRRSAKKIFMTGGWTEIEDALKSSKEIGKPWILKSKCKVHSSTATGFLKYEQLLFVSSDDLKRDIEDMWNKVLVIANENRWRSVCFPVDSSLMSSVAELMAILHVGVSEKLESSLELKFCLWDTKDQLRGHILDICNQLLSSEVYYPIHFLDVKTEKMQTTKKGWHSIDVRLEKGSLLEVAEAKKVDVIVNSTNPELDLSQGYVSKSIRQKAGSGIEDELKTIYKDGIEFGDMAISSGHGLEFHVFHGALYKWISTGNLSLKVLKCFINKCLLAMERNGFRTIAFPALGTGRLGYPYILVAKTMMECVTDFGRQHPETCIQTVYIVVHDQDMHCLQVFKDVFENPDITSQLAITDILSKPTISFLENRIPKRNLLIQLLPEEIYEVVDAVIKFSSKESSTGDVDFRWCSKIGCYYAVMPVTKERVQTIVDQCFRMLDSKRITSASLNLADFMKDSEMYTAIIEAFFKILTKSIDKQSPGLSLRKLQFLVCKKEYEKMEHMDPKHNSWFGNLIKKDPNITWIKKTVKRQRDLLVSVFGPSRDHIERVLNEFRESVTSATGNWCVERDYKWAFVSSITSIKLNQAEEQGVSTIEIKEEDGIYDYDIEIMRRTPSKENGDKKPEKIRCLPYREKSKPFPGMELWYVLLRDKWVLLPEETCRMLTDAKKLNKTEACDDQYVYYLKSDERKEKGKVGVKEEIMLIKVNDDGNLASGGRNIKAKQSSTNSIKQTDEEKENIFDFVTGQVTYLHAGNEISKINIEKILDSVGCQVITRTDCTFFIKGSLLQIAKVNELITTPEQKTISMDTETFACIVTIPMSYKEYEVFKHFGTECQWFKKYGNNLVFNENGLNCDVPIDDEEQVKKEMIKHLEYVRRMSSDYTEIIENQDCNIAAIIQNIQEKFQTVYLVINKKVIELTSDSYEDLLKVKNLLNQQMSGIKNRRAGRTFEKTPENTEDPRKAESSSDVYKGDVYAGNRSKYTTQQQKELEVKTKEGLKIKIYAGSIVRLNVDCIVNAANERLMHGGGVAFAISEAAGYQFDQDSRDYVQKHGPIPVGSCCVTSAGNLPCKFVIHTVGPRWDDYRDKNRCLQLLYDSVQVTFIEAEKRGLKSLAIPAISSGIFAVPRDLCVQQYYKAVMSFSREHSVKSLQEIHFVDKDESMVRAIQEIFQSKEPYASNTVKTNLDNKNDTPAFVPKNSFHSTIPPSNAYTIVGVSENLQIKIHIGSIKDIAADAIVCPQDEYCNSEDVIARDIFRDIPDEKPVSKRMKLGDIFPQRLQKSSQWKMIIHAVAPVYDEKQAKDATKFGKALNTIMQFIMETADEKKAESIAIPLLGTGIGEYKTPINTCAYNFAQAVMAKKSELMFLKDIYLVLKNNEDEKNYLEHFEIYKCKIINRTLVDSGNSVSLATTLKGTPKDVDNCCICMDPPTNPKQLKKCGHIFCKECIDECFQYKPACPSCGMIYGKVTGDQPPGSITMRKNYTKLEGFNDSNGSIILTYTFDNGYQGEEHSDPGKGYRGISRSGYVPNNERGRLVAKLLNVAFSRRLVFTIGRSRTTGHDGVITWNDIHHKTRPDGGAAKFGYPDATYLDRVLEELEAKGVTEDSADDPEEYKEYSKLFRY